MKFLWISEEGYTMDIALRVMQEGNQVKMWTKEKECKDVALGIVPLVPDYEPWIKWADVIFVDDSVKLGDTFRKMGKKVFGGGKLADQMEDDREAGMELAASVGMQVPEHWTFKNAQEAESFIRKNPGRYALKPHDTDVKNLCFIGKEPDGKDVLSFFESIRIEGSKDFGKSRITLQRVIDGIEVAVTCVCDGRKVARTKNCNFEHKRLLAGNLGPLTAETGTTLYFRDTPQRIFQLTVDKLAPFLVKNQYQGFWDVNLIANEQGLWFLEHTPRPGLPTIQIMDEVMNMDWSKFIADVALGQLNDWETTNDFAVGIVVYAEGWPFSKSYKDYGHGREVLGIDSLDHLHLMEVKRLQERFFCTGYFGWPLIATGRGGTIDQARKMALSMADHVDFPAKGYNVDIAKKSQRDYDRLIAMRYLSA